jgi:hypothetical protein
MLVNGWDNLHNHLGDFYKGFRIKALFSWGHVGLVWLCEEGGLKEVLEYFYGIQYFVCVGEWKTLLGKVCVL